MWVTHGQHMGTSTVFIILIVAIYSTLQINVKMTTVKRQLPPFHLQNRRQKSYRRKFWENGDDTFHSQLVVTFN